MVVSAEKRLKYWVCGASVEEWYTRFVLEALTFTGNFIVFVRDFFLKFLIALNAPFIDFIKDWFHIQALLEKIIREEEAYEGTNIDSMRKHGISGLSNSVRIELCLNLFQKNVLFLFSGNSRKKR